MKAKCKHGGLFSNRTCFIIKKGFNMMIYVGFAAIVMALVCTMGILCGKIDLGK